MTAPADGTLTVAETAKLLGRSTEQVRRYLREGVLPGRRLGGQWFVARGDVERLLGQRQAPQSPILPAPGETDPDPLGAAIAVGGSGGAEIARGATHYLCSLPGATTRD
jgi:excisionase family DNA binding protein